MPGTPVQVPSNNRRSRKDTVSYNAQKVETYGSRISLIGREDSSKIGVGIQRPLPTTALYGLAAPEISRSGTGASSPVPTDKMTYQLSRRIKDQVSLPGVWLHALATNHPTGRKEVINQETVNELRYEITTIPTGQANFDHRPYMYTRAGRKKQQGAPQKASRRKTVRAAKLSDFSNFSH